MWTRMVAIPALLLLFAACSTPAPPPPPASATPGTDMAWLQLTLALNQRALQTLSLVPERASDSRLVSLAAELAAGHSQENAQLLALLNRIGAPAENPHSGMDMPGMATPAEISSMSAAHGEAFDKLFVDSLRKHLTQCQSLAQSMLQAGRVPDALGLAAAIESARRQALTRLAPWAGR